MSQRLLAIGEEAFCLPQVPPQKRDSGARRVGSENKAQLVRLRKVPGVFNFPFRVPEVAAGYRQQGPKQLGDK